MSERRTAIGLPEPRGTVVTETKEYRMGHRRRWSGLPVMGISLCALALGAVCAAPMIGLDGFVGELAASWRPHIALGVLTCAAAALAARLRLLAGLLAALAVTLGADVIETELRSAQAEARSGMRDSGDAVRVVFANILKSNDDVGRFTAWIRDSDADVVVATEVLPRHIEEMAGPMADYPFRKLEPRGHPFGMVVYSRHPISGEAVNRLAGITGTEWGPVMVTVGVETPAGTLHIAGLHVFPPVTPHRFSRRNEQFDTVADILAEVETPRLVVGDFNATPVVGGPARVPRGDRPAWFQHPGHLARLVRFRRHPDRPRLRQCRSSHSRHRNRSRHRIRSSAGHDQRCAGWTAGWPVDEGKIVARCAIRIERR